MQYSQESQNDLPPTQLVSTSTTSTLRSARRVDPQEDEESDSIPPTQPTKTSSKIQEEEDLSSPIEQTQRVRRRSPHSSDREEEIFSSPPPTQPVKHDNLISPIGVSQPDKMSQESTKEDEESIAPTQAVVTRSSHDNYILEKLFNS
jgi:hypothetical protein